MITRKVNLGGYENIDYSLGIDIVGFDSKSAKKIQDAIDFGRELCLKDTTEYYKKVKQELSGGETLSEEVDETYLSLEKRINKSENEGQLRTLESKVQEIEDDKMQKIMQKKFNLKLIALKKS